MPCRAGRAAVVGLVMYALCSAYADQMGDCRDKALCAGLLVAYVAMVVAATVLSRKVGGEEWHGFLAAGGVAGLLHASFSGIDALANALMLLPMGMLLPVVTGWHFGRTALSCLAFSTWVEVVQLLCAVGCPDPSDAVLNRPT